MTKRSLVHRDQIHGDATLDAMGAALLNTVTLQRLGRVYQLGYAHLVYRGGNHTRLSHVIGTAHTADVIVNRLKENYEQPREQCPKQALPPEEFLPLLEHNDIDDRWDILRHLVRWAALLHDIGHVPLGHTLEDEFEGIFVKHDSFGSPRIPYLWGEVAGHASPIRETLQDESLWPSSFERAHLTKDDVWRTVMLITLYKEDRDERHTFIEELGAFKKKLTDAPIDLAKSTDAASAAPSKSDRLAKTKARAETIAFIKLLEQATAELSRKTLFFPYMADIVGNTICADYLDYVRRDPTNVGLDILRDDRIIRRFYVAQDPNRPVGQSSNGQPQRTPRMALALVDHHGKNRLDTCTGVVELVRQRYRFAEIIYYHKTKVSASAMFAKALHLLGRPGLRERRRRPRPLLKPETLATSIADCSPGHRSTYVRRWRARYEAQALLDVEVGDETLPLLVEAQAWRKLEHSPDAKNAEELLRCIELLRALQERRLYKIAATIDTQQFHDLSPGFKDGVDADHRVLTEIKSLRSEPKRRAKIEEQMNDAGRWSTKDAAILYVPPPKNQAKGIETFALDSNGVTTLSEHPAVKDKVAVLNADYRGLWKMIILIHPNLRDDHIGLSRAIDAMCTSIWGEINFADHLATLRACCWFQYLPTHTRASAERFQALWRAGDQSVETPSYDTLLSIFDLLDTRAPALSELTVSRLGELAYVAALLGKKGYNFVEAVAQQRLDIAKLFALHEAEVATDPTDKQVQQAWSEVVELLLRQPNVAAPAAAPPPVTEAVPVGVLTTRDIKQAEQLLKVAKDRRANRKYEQEIKAYETVLADERTDTYAFAAFVGRAGAELRLLDRALFPASKAAPNPTAVAASIKRVQEDYERAVALAGRFPDKETQEELERVAKHLESARIRASDTEGEITRPVYDRLRVKPVQTQRELLAEMNQNDGVVPNDGEEIAAHKRWEKALDRVEGRDRGNTKA